MAAPDTRKLEPVKNNPGIYRKHGLQCTRSKKCGCPYVVRWKHQGKTHKRSFPTLDLAREFKGGITGKTTSRRPPATATVADYYAKWLPGYRGRTSRGLQDSTRTELEISFRRHILPLPVGRAKMRDIDAPAVRDWLHELERRDTPPRTIRKAKAALSVMFSCAVEDGDIAFNHATSVRYVPSDAAKRKHAKPKPKDLTAEDIRGVLAAMPDKWRVFFILLAQTGVRIGELLGLTWANVHLGDDPRIGIVEQVYKGKRKQTLKTESSRGEVPISPIMASWLTELHPEGVAPSVPVFPSSTGTPLSYANVRSRVLRPALIEAGVARRVGTDAKGNPTYSLDGRAFHHFRHACGSLLHAHGRTPAQMQHWLRHGQLTTTLDTYTHLSDDGLGRADMWDEILIADADAGATPGATQHPETAANGTPPKRADSAV